MVCVIVQVECVPGSKLCVGHKCAAYRCESVRLVSRGNAGMSFVWQVGRGRGGSQTRYTLGFRDSPYSLILF
jgi:hypothetical protein